MSREELITFFDSVRQLYPAGVPRSAIVKKSEEGRVSVLFLGDDEVGEDGFPKGHSGEILKSAVTKGLGLRLSQVRYGKHGELFDRSPDCILVLGGKERGAWRDVDGISTLDTCSLNDVVSSPESKRIFWNDLKQVILRLKDS